MRSWKFSWRTLDVDERFCLATEPGFIEGVGDQRRSDGLIRVRLDAGFRGDSDHEVRS
jgi:hypothetical protein